MKTTKIASPDRRPEREAEALVTPHRRAARAVFEAYEEAEAAEAAS